MSLLICNFNMVINLSLGLANCVVIDLSGAVENVRSEAELRDHADGGSGAGAGEGCGCFAASGQGSESSAWCAVWGERSV